MSNVPEKRVLKELLNFHLLHKWGTYHIAAIKSVEAERGCARGKGHRSTGSFRHED